LVFLALAARRVVHEQLSSLNLIALLAFPDARLGAKGVKYERSDLASP